MMNEPQAAWKWILENIKTLDAVGGLKPFPNYDFARRLVEALCAERILIVAKSRQMMATWTVLAVTVYRALFNDAGIYLFLSKGARDSGELIKRMKTIVRMLPEEEGQGIKVTKEEVVFPTGVRIISLPATEFAPRMHSPTCVFWDELAFTPKAEDIWTSVKPAVDSGGAFIGVSTPNGSDNLFHRLFTENNGFGKLRLHYCEHPRRDEAWKLEAMRGMSIPHWRQEYEVDFNVFADRVFDEYDPDVHILRTPFNPLTAGGHIYRGIDFGYRHPYVVWASLSPMGEMTIFDEWEGENATVEELAQAISRVDARNGIRESNVVFSGCDPAGAACADVGVSAVERLGGMGFKLAYRTSGISAGVDLIKSLLKDAAGTVRLRFAARAEATIFHFTHYRWDKNGDKPDKGDGHDHAVDALRYLIINLFGRKPVNWSGAMVRGAAR